MDAPPRLSDAPISTNDERASGLRGPMQPLARAASLLGVLVAAAGAWFVLSQITGQWPEIRRVLRSAEWVWLLPACVLATASVCWLAVGWRFCLAALGSWNRRVDVVRWYLLGQLGKYLPGGIWPVVGRSELARRGGVHRSTAYNSVGLSMAVTYIAASLTVLALAPFDVSLGSSSPGTWWLILLMPLGMIILHPRILKGLLSLAERLFSDGAETPIPSWGASVKLVAVHIPSWVGIGLSTWFVARAFSSSAPMLELVITGIASWIVGFAALPVPSGIGVREAAFVAMAASLTPSIAATTAVASRLLFMSIDALAALVVAPSLRQRLAEPVSPSAVA